MPVFELFIDFTFPLSSGLPSCAVEKFSHFGLWFLAWNLGRNRLLSSYFSYFLCRLKFNGSTSRKSLSCSAKRTGLFFLLFLDLWRAKPSVNKLDSALFYLYKSKPRWQIWQLRCKSHFKPSWESMKLSLIERKILNSLSPFFCRLCRTSAILI